MQPAVAGPRGEMQRGGHDKILYAEWTRKSPSTSHWWAVWSAVLLQVFGVVTWGHGRSTVSGAWRHNPHAAPGVDPHPPIQREALIPFWGKLRQREKWSDLSVVTWRNYVWWNWTVNLVTWARVHATGFILWLGHEANSPFKIVSFRGGLGVHL